MKMGSKKALISIVVSVFNEAGNLEQLYIRIKGIFEDIDYDFELILVESGSTDESLEVAEGLHKKDPRVKILSLSKNFGHQVSLSAGIDHAQGEAVILMDADLQHPPEVIPELISKWREGYENVYTIRKVSKNFSLIQKYSSLLFYHIFRFLTKLDLPINSADFRLLDKKLVLEFKKIKERSRFLRGLIYWTGFRSVGIEYQQQSRYSGKTKYHFKKKLLFAFEAIISFTNIPLYIGIVIGLIFAIFGLLYTIYAFYMYVFTGANIPGWLSIVCLLSVLGGIQLIVIGLVGVYVGKIFEEVKQRPLYITRYSKGLNE